MVQFNDKKFFRELAKFGKLLYIFLNAAARKFFERPTIKSQEKIS